MAVKPDDKDKEKKTSKKKDQAGMGHNLAEIRKRAEPAIKEIIAKFTAMHSDMGTYREEIKELYDKHAGTIGMSKKLLRTEVAKVMAKIRQEQEELGLEASEREQIETLRSALEGTPMGRYMADKLAVPAKAV